MREGDEVSGSSRVAATRTETGVSRAASLGLYACAASIGLLAMQALAAGRLELTFDEAYYTLWSRSLSFGYLDHPPMVALVIRASTSLFGGSELGVRALSLLVVGAMPALIALIAWRLFDSVEKAALEDVSANSDSSKLQMHFKADDKQFQSLMHSDLFAAVTH